MNGTALRELRQLAGLNIVDLAQRAKVSDGYISHIELGRRHTVSPRVFGQICDALGVENRRDLMSPAA